MIDRDLALAHEMLQAMAHSPITWAIIVTAILCATGLWWNKKEWHG